MSDAKNDLEVYGCFDAKPSDPCLNCGQPAMLRDASDRRFCSTECQDTHPHAGTTSDFYEEVPEMETAGEQLARIGTDAQKWAAEFVRMWSDQTPDEYTMLTWFANAIEVGRSEGYSQAKREHVPGWPLG